MIPKINFFINSFAHTSTFATLNVQACSKYETFSNFSQKVKTYCSANLNPISF
jgi:hypothetical protein